jgi:hypothetical protein
MQRRKGCAQLTALIVGELPVPSRSGDHAPPDRLGHNLVRIKNSVRSMLRKAETSTTQSRAILSASVNSPTFRWEQKPA